MKKISKYHSNVSPSGLVITCPHCLTKATVYGMAWCAFSCQGCKRMVDKTDYLIEEKMQKIYSVNYRYSNALLNACDNLPARTIAEAEQHKGMLLAENIIIAMDALYKYALEHKKISEDYVLGREWLDAIKGVRGLLNGAGHFDGGTLEEVFWRALNEAGFREEDL